MGNETSYIFKTSESSMKLAAMMAGHIKVGGYDSLLTEEPAYFDGMHSHVKYFVTRTLWVFHPAMLGMKMLGIMDAMKEHSDHIELFFTLFNEALRDYLDDPKYMWDFHLIMMDEKGANFEAIERVFGPEFWHTKSVSCQWHFMHCAEKYLGKVDESDQKKFREWCQKLLEAHTKTDYRFWAEKIQGFAKEHGFEGWWKWWAPRSPHLVPAIRGFGIPKMNMAKTGQSKLANANQQCRKLWLSEAATVYVVEFTFQAEQYNKLITSLQCNTYR